jgi:hypothetical protein
MSFRQRFYNNLRNRGALQKYAEVARSVALCRFACGLEKTPQAPLDATSRVVALAVQMRSFTADKKLKKESKTQSQANQLPHREYRVESC